MSKYDYTRFKIRIAPDSKKRQGLRTGDVVRRQYVDGASVYYSLMVVLSAGEDLVELADGKHVASPYFIGGLIEGDAPRDGELLDFVRLTSLLDDRRGGAMYLTASDDEAPYLDVIDGMGTERSLCRPASLAEYSCSGGAALDCRYTAFSGEASRIVRMTRTASATGTMVGSRIPLPPKVSHPGRLVISYRIRASRVLTGVPLSFGYTDGQETDGRDSVNVTTQWQYRLTLITVDFPAAHARSLTLDLTAHLTPGDWCEIADLNVCLLEHLATFDGATKARVGKITGISDPLFGMLQGYGAYFQRLYATRDVNIAGTLTAGDEAGFGSTFYVGRIHKNCFVNSLEPGFQPTAILYPDVPPAGIGKCFRIAAGETKVVCQSEAWTRAHAGERYCFSFWARNDTDTVATLRYGTSLLQEITVGREWKRYHAVFVLKHMAGNAMYLSLSGAAGCLFSSPQLERGETPSLYQPTDGTLDETEAFGAWLCRGGIGGTIQHPLLRLEADGSIRAGNDSFVIRPDGSGYFSGGAIRWDDEAVTLSDRVLLKWENLDDETRHNLTGQDAYTVYSGTPGCIFQTSNTGVITSDQRIEARIYAYKGREPVAFRIGVLPAVAGMELSVGDGQQSVIVLARDQSSDLPDYGSVEIPVVADGIVFHVPFSWSKARAGVPGDDFTAMDWLADWDSHRTQIGASTLVTPKIFAGVKHGDDTVTGVAMGDFDLNVRQSDGSVASVHVGGISAFREGIRTFYVDDTGNAGLGNGDQSVSYNARTGRIVFGAGVSLNWTSAIGQAKTETLNAAAATAQGKADAALASAKGYTNTKKTEAVTEAGKNTDSKIGALTTTLNASIAEAKKAGTDARAVADALNSKATGEGWSKKLTYIDANGIFTGTLSANVVNAFRLNASQITAGTIATARLNAAEIKANIINAAYISGLACTFVRGRIGGWDIGATTLSNSHILLDSGNKRVVVYGASSSATSGKRVQLYYDSDSNFGFYATDAGGNCVARLGSTNQIAGWSIDVSRIYKNNVALGADGTIANGTKWKLANDGSGSLASGNITWNASGTVTFGASVSLNWTNAANSALNSAKSYADTKKTEAINSAAKDATTKSDAAKELARGMAFGKMLYRDPTFRNGLNDIRVYNNLGNGLVSVSRVSMTAPNDSGYVLEIKNTGTASPGCGGFYFGTTCAYRKIYITRVIAKIPAGYRIEWASNSIGTSGSSKWLTPTAGTGDWCEYIYKVTCGTASFSSTNFFYLIGALGTTAAPLTWHVAYATVFDVTTSERYTTTIDANGIYTGTLTAAQVNAVAINAASIKAGTLSADRIAAGSIHSAKLDAASIRANIINVSYINGLSCTFTRGRIGGWAIGSDNITTGSIGTIGAMPIQIRSAASGAGYWYAGAYKPLGIVMTWHQSSNAGHVVFGQIAASGSTVKTGFLGIQMMAWDGVEYFCLSANYTRSGSKEVYNRIAGWAFDNTRIYKNNVILGADGSITNSSRWRLNNDGSAQFGSGKLLFRTDGSGYVANNKFSWDANGNITAVGGSFRDVTIQGTIRSAFVLNDPSIWIGGSDSSQQDPRHYDNVVCIQTGSWNQNINLPWTLNNSGRRVCLVNYKWGSTVSSGYMSISAPSGKYFFEDGISKSTLKFSREVVELLGYGDNKTFFGWIVLNRRDMMTSGRYGKFQQVLISGIVTGSTSSASIRYKTFDGSTGVSVSRQGKGMYRVYLPYSWYLNGKYMVMATGIYSAADNTPIYPTIKAIYSYYFDIYTQDDASRNDGSFNFQVISTNNWDH